MLGRCSANWVACSAPITRICTLHPSSNIQQPSFPATEQGHPPSAPPFQLAMPPSGLPLTSKWVDACFHSLPHGGSWLLKRRATFNSDYKQEVIASTKTVLFKTNKQTNDCSELASCLPISSLPTGSKTCKEHWNMVEMNTGLLHCAKHIERQNLS